MKDSIFKNFSKRYIQKKNLFHPIKHQDKTHTKYIYLKKRGHLKRYQLTKVIQFPPSKRQGKWARVNLQVSAATPIIKLGVITLGQQLSGSIAPNKLLTAGTATNLQDIAYRALQLKPRTHVLVSGWLNIRAWSKLHQQLIQDMCKKIGPSVAGFHHTISKVVSAHR